jgi:hypothetical protein
MTDALKTLQDDISFLKTLAEDDRSPALLGGAILVAAGSIYGVASVAHWAVLTWPAGVSPWIFPEIWLGATALFLVTIFVLCSRLRGNRATSRVNRSSALAWTGLGCTIFTLWACMAIVAWRANSATPMLLFPSIVLALYGMAWMVAAAATPLRWIPLAAAGSFIGAIVTALVCLTPTVFLVYTLALALVAVAPGVALIRLGRDEA